MKNLHHLLHGKKLCFTFCLLIFIGGAAAHQVQDDDVVRVTTTLVKLNIGVVDRRGNSVTDLSRNDFAVFEDGTKQNIVSFEPTLSPFSLVLLLDMSSSTSSFRPSLKQAALRFIDALDYDDRIAIVTFTDRHEVLTKFTTDRRKIAWAIERAEGRGSTHLFDALSASLDLLAGEGNRRKAIIVLTDGLDTGMRNQDRAASLNATNETEALKSVKPDSSQSLRSVLDLADQQGVTIYPLALPSGDPKRLPIQTPQLTAIYSAAKQRLQLLADRSGGRLNEIRRLEDMGRLYAEVAADMRTLYSISYRPSNTAKQGTWRTIRIEVSRPNLIARTRPGYFAR
jgi:Ca-activated chloride channel homolog